MSAETPVTDEFAPIALKLALVTSVAMSPLIVVALAMGHLEPLIGLFAFWAIGSLGLAGLYALERSV